MLEGEQVGGGQGRWDRPCYIRAVFVLIALALAADQPFLVLPADENPAAWSAAATLAGLTLGSAPSGTTVELLHDSTGWSLLARNGSGDEKRVSVAAPTSPQAREDAAWLAASLVNALPHAPSRPAPASRGPTPTPAPALTQVAPPAQPPRPASPQAPIRRTPPSPAIVPTVETTTPAPSTPVTQGTVPGALSTQDPPAPAPLTPSEPVATVVSETPAPAPTPSAAMPAPATAPPAAAPPDPVPPDLVCPPIAPAAVEAAPITPRRAPLHASFWAAAGPTVAWRIDTSLGAGADLTAGLRTSDAVWLGLGARWLAPRTFPEVRSSVVEPTLDVYAGAWWSPGRTFAPLVGAAGGVSSRSYAQGLREVDRFLIPFGDLDAGARLKLGPKLDLTLVARLRADASVTLATIGDADPIALSPWELDGRLSLWGTLP